MSSSNPSKMSTKEKLLQIVDDIELISRELVEILVFQKVPKPSKNDYQQLGELLVLKDQELKDMLKVAGEQGDLQRKLDLLQAEIEKQDQDLHHLQKQLKEAEHILSTAIYQAKQKLQAIHKAQERPVASEELIKYAHRISSSNAIAAPHNWQPGDQRRPYPTDTEMRMGFLGRLSDLPPQGSGHLLPPNVQQPPSGSLPPDMSTAAAAAQRGGAKPRYAGEQAGTFTWQSQADMKFAATQQQPTPPTAAIEPKSNKETEDVEVMSTDSSSSSSSDSQ